MKVYLFTNLIILKVNSKQNVEKIYALLIRLVAKTNINYYQLFICKKYKKSLFKSDMC